MIGVYLVEVRKLFIFLYECVDLRDISLIVIISLHEASDCE